MNPLSPRDRGHERYEAEDHVKFPIPSTRQMPVESEFLRCTKDDGCKHETEEPPSMCEIVVSQIDEGVPGDVWEDYRRSHVHADRLQHDDNEGQEGPITARAQAETRPPHLNGNEEREPGPDHGREVELHLRPGQDEPAQALQDLRDRQPNDDREEDREVVKGFHGAELGYLQDHSSPQKSRKRRSDELIAG